MIVQSFVPHKWVAVPNLNFEFKHFPMKKGMVGLPEGLPYFHRHDVTGHSTKIVRRFFEDDELSTDDLQWLKEYLIQWFVAMWYQSPYPESKLALLELVQATILVDSDRQLRFVVDSALSACIDPF